MNKRLTATTIAVLLLTFSNSMFAQVSTMGFIRDQVFKPGIHFQTWSFRFNDADNLSRFTIDRFTEVAFPMIYAFPVNNRLSLDILTSPFLSTLQPATGSDSDFNNITDTIIRTTYIIGDDRALFILAVSLPNGKANLSDEEFAIAGVAATRVLDYPVTLFGSGLNLNFGFATAREFGSWVLGAGLGYSFRGKYDAISDTEEIKISPGDEFNLTVGIDRDFEIAKGTAKFTADLTYTNYSEDDLRGVPFFEAGDKLLLQGRLIFSAASFDPIIISALNRFRLDNTSTNAELIDNGNEFETSVTLFQPLGEKFKLKFLFDSKIYTDTVADAEGASVFGVGGGLVYRVSDSVLIDPSFKFSTGGINLGPGNRIDITGYEVAGGISIRF